MDLTLLEIMAPFYVNSMNLYCTTTGHIEAKSVEQAGDPDHNKLMNSYPAPMLCLCCFPVNAILMPMPTNNLSQEQVCIMSFFCS
jgi:hypothetical protein